MDNDLGLADTLTYPVCNLLCVGIAPSRSVSLGYTSGALTSVNGYATLSYAENGMLSQIQNANGVTWSQAIDPSRMPRPASITASGNGISWSTGSYLYDGSGNIKTIGSDVYTYDTAGRILRGTAYSVGNAEQRYAYDSFGNLLTTETWLNGGLSESRSTPTDSGTNHMFGNGATYDAAGNLATWTGWTYQGQTYTYSYDAMNNLTMLVGNASPSYQKDWTYFYDADDERVWQYNNITHRSRYRVRGLDSNKVLREFTRDGWDLNNPFGSQGTWSWLEDWVWRDGNSLLSGVNSTNTFFFHLDHLGTPRVVSTFGYGPYDTRTYYPFGEEATSQDTGNYDFMHYTGHERDVFFGERNSFDYMHARHYDAMPGRFLSVDSVRGNPFLPQSWNKYSYVLGNPIKFIDPSGHGEQLGAMPTPLPYGEGPDWFFGWFGSTADGRFLSRTENIADRAKNTICSAFPSGRTTGVSGALGAVGSGEAGGEVVVNYDSGQVSAFGFGGLQGGWNGVASGSLYSGFVWGLNSSNSNYSGGFTGVVAGGTVGGFAASSSGGLTSGPAGLAPSSGVKVVGGSVGASLVGPFSGGVNATNYSDPVQLGKYWGFGPNELDWLLYAARQACK